LWRSWDSAHRITSRDLLERLEGTGKLPPGSTAKFGLSFAFRNRIVHLYDRVDDATVFEIVTEHLGDLEQLALAYSDILTSK